MSSSRKYALFGTLAILLYIGCILFFVFDPWGKITEEEIGFSIIMLFAIGVFCIPVAIISAMGWMGHDLNKPFSPGKFIVDRINESND